MIRSLEVSDHKVDELDAEVVGSTKLYRERYLAERRRALTLRSRILSRLYLLPGYS